MKRLAALLLVALPALGQVGPSSGAKPGTCPTGQFMFKTSSSANPSCAVPGAGGTVLTTKGDLLGFSNTAARFPVGPPGTVPTADPSATLGISYQSVGSSVSCFSSGVGSPEGVVTAVTGCTYVNTSNSDIYTKAYGSGNTGWVLTTAPGFLYGAGSPEGAQVGYIGDLYLRTSDLHWWQKQTGDGTNTGWVDIGTSPPPGGGRKITGVGTPNRLAYWTGQSVLGFSTATWNNSTGALTATTFAGDLNGTINTATTATTQSANDNSTKVATTAYVDAIGSSTLIADVPQGRLTLTSATAVTTSDVTAALLVYYTPYVGAVIPLYYSGQWRPYTLTEKSIKVTDSAQTGTMTSGTKVITGLTDTSQLVRGMEITGTSVGAASVIASVDSATQVTGTVNSTGSTTNSVTFKVPASTIVDVVAEPTSASTYRLRFLTLWSNSGAGTSARAVALTTQNSIYMNGLYASGDSNTIAAGAARYLGSIRTTATTGQTEDSAHFRYLWNMYGRVARSIAFSDSTASWTYSTTNTFRQQNASTNNQVNILNGLVVDAISVTAGTRAKHSASFGDIVFAIGRNSTTATISGYAANTLAADQNGPLQLSLSDLPPLGYNFYATLEASSTAGTQTYLGGTTFAGSSPSATGMSGISWQ